MIYFIAFALLLTNSPIVNCHGRLLNPISRTSAWRVSGRFPNHFDDSGMNCGGLNTQIINDGKCGICGENFVSKKEFEKGGRFYRGYIVKKYDQGDKIQVTVEITANHGGYFQFGICNIDTTKSDATQDCLDKNKLLDINNQSKIFVQKGVNGKINTILQLPQDLTCDHCVFQWKYTAQNNWGFDPIKGKSCTGCGPQEQFYGCSDVSIIRKFQTSLLQTLVSKPQIVTKPSYLTSYLDVTTTNGSSSTTSVYPTTFYQYCHKGDGYYTWSGCESFYRCNNNIVFHFDCPRGTLFDTRYNICNWPYNVKCEID